MPYKFIQYITPVSITTIINLSLIFGTLYNISIPLIFQPVFPWSFGNFCASSGFGPLGAKKPARGLSHPTRRPRGTVCGLT